MEQFAKWFNSMDILNDYCAVFWHCLSNIHIRIFLSDLPFHWGLAYTKTAPLMSGLGFFCLGGRSSLCTRVEENAGWLSVLKPLLLLKPTLPKVCFALSLLHQHPCHGQILIWNLYRQSFQWNLLSLDQGQQDLGKYWIHTWKNSTNTQCLQYIYIFFFFSAKLCLGLLRVLQELMKGSPCYFESVPNIVLLNFTATTSDHFNDDLKNSNLCHGNNVSVMVCRPWSHPTVVWYTIRHWALVVEFRFIPVY